MKKHFGFTLIEVMVTLAVGIIILAIGVPSFLNMMSSNQAAGYSNDLVGALRLARSEAVKRSSTVTICAGNDDLSGCSAGTWNNGWIVFNDVNGDAVQDAGEATIRVWPIPANERAQLEFNAATPDSVSFTASGANSLDEAIPFVLMKSDCHANQARRITISRLGRASLDLVACF
jgi:type IV fimbrial biogenesis protein FimT